MTQEIEQLDIFDFLDEPQVEEVAGEITLAVRIPEEDEPVCRAQKDAIPIGKRVRIVDETKFLPFRRALERGYCNGRTATVMSNFYGVVEIWLDVEWQRTEPRVIPSSIGLFPEEYAAVEVM